MPTVIVVGSGLAGLIAAVRATDAGHSVTLVTKAALPESNTRHAQGGIAAALFPDDAVDTHLADTIRAGAGLCDADAARVLCTEGPARVRDLIRFGVAFDRDESGLTRGLEAAHSRSRVLHAGGDATGAAISGALVATLQRRAMRNSSLRIFEHTMLAQLVVRDGRVVGVTVLTAGPDPVPGGDRGPVRRETLVADAVILATGGAGALYRHTTNPAGATGDGVAAAWRAGASVADLEFYQFHPTALAVPGRPLISEAVRGEGAVLRNARGERFMLAAHPDAELAPRDVVARTIAGEMAAQGGQPVTLDATGLGRELLEARFPTLTAACRRAGLDWAVEPIPVAPAAHYGMGGIVTDLWGRTTLAGLFAVGEAARTGAHGANRLASNSLLEAAVFADRAVRALGAAPFDGDFAQNTRSTGVAGTVSAKNSVEFDRDGTGAGAGAGTGAGAGGFSREALQELMWREAGVLRSGAGLAAASVALAGWTADDSAPGVSGTGLVRAQEDANLLDLARLTVRAALAREESRGAHFRADCAAARPELARSQAWTRGLAHPAPLGGQGLSRAATRTTPTPEAEEAIAC